MCEEKPDIDDDRKSKIRKARLILLGSGICAASMDGLIALCDRMEVVDTVQAAEYLARSISPDVPLSLRPSWHDQLKELAIYELAQADDTRDNSKTSGFVLPIQGIATQPVNRRRRRASNRRARDRL